MSHMRLYAKEICTEWSKVLFKRGEQIYAEKLEILLYSYGGRKGVRISQKRDAFTLPVKLQARPIVNEGHQMILESILRESVVNI